MWWYASFLVVAQILSAGSALAQGAGQERRTALIIGNSAYRQSPLVNPVNDAQAMAAALGSLGFAVTRLENASKSQMNDALRSFGDSIQNGGIGLFYFAGHGMQVSGQNFLIPVDANIAREDEVPSEGIEMNLVLRKMDSAKNRLNIVILDACRNNPFARSFRSSTRGLAAMDAPVSTILAFSTAPGSVAADGSGQHGVYTEYLLRNLTEPGLKIEEVFKRTRFAVRQETRGQQIPWENTSLVEDFFFIAPPPGSPALSGQVDAEMAFWNTIKDSRNPAEFEAYMRRYPTGQFVQLARQYHTSLLASHPESSSGRSAAGPTAEKPVRSQEGFSFSREEERDRVTRLAKDDEIRARLQAPCPEPLRQRPIVIDLAEESRAAGLVLTESSSRFAQLVSQNLQQAGLTTRLARTQGQPGSLAPDVAGRSSARSPEASRHQGSYSIQGVVFSQQGANRVVRLKEASVSAELVLRDPTGRILTMVEVSGVGFSGQDTSASARALTKEQASDASSQLYAAFCRAAVTMQRPGR
jgi:hypothetical protein